MKRTHELKTWPAYFGAIWEGTKKFEVRKNRDRDFEIDDTLFLREYDPDTGTYSGRYIICRVGFMVSGEWGIPDDVSVMSLMDIHRSQL